MARAYVSVGSNVDREANVRGVLKTLRRSFRGLRVSTVYETPAVDMDGDDFYNLVVAFDTDLAPSELVSALHAIESDHGRTRGGSRFLPRSLDLDLLLYDDLVCHEGMDVPREDIVRYAFVLRPLAELAGSERHPESGRTFAQLWESFDGEVIDMRPVVMAGAGES